MGFAPTTSPELSPASKELFMAYWDDQGNWDGTPLVGGNVESSTENNGHITDLKKKGLIKTFDHDGHMWIEFTEAAQKLIRQCRDCGKDIMAGEPWNRCDECSHA